jgi:hypothetical protein
METITTNVETVSKPLSKFNRRGHQCNCDLLFPATTRSSNKKRPYDVISDQLNRPYHHHQKTKDVKSPRLAHYFGNRPSMIILNSSNFTPTMMMKRRQPIIPTSFHLYESHKKRQKKTKPEVSSSCNYYDEQARVLQALSSQYYLNYSRTPFNQNTVPSLPFNIPLHNAHQTTYPPSPPTSLSRQESILHDGDKISTFGCKFYFVDVDLFRTRNTASKQTHATTTPPPLLSSSFSSEGYISTGSNTGTSIVAPNPLIRNSPTYCSALPKNHRRVTTPALRTRNSSSYSIPPKNRRRVDVPRPRNSNSIEAPSSLKKWSQSPDVVEGPTEPKEQRESLLEENPASQQETNTMSFPKFPAVLNADKRGAIKSLLQAFNPPLSNNPGTRDSSVLNVSDASTDAPESASLHRALGSLYHEIQERKPLVLQLAKACGSDSPEAVVEAPDLVEWKTLLLHYLMGKSPQESQPREESSKEQPHQPDARIIR